MEGVRLLQHISASMHFADSAGQNMHAGKSPVQCAIIESESLARWSCDWTFGEQETTETFSQLTSAQHVVAARQMDGKAVFAVSVGQTRHTWGVSPPSFLGLHLLLLSWGCFAAPPKSSFRAVLYMRSLIVFLSASGYVHAPIPLSFTHCYSLSAPN